MGLPVRAETRTGDTPQNRRVRQRERPARPPADHAGVAGAAALLSRRGAVLRQPAMRDRRRAACAGHHQARRPAGAGPVAAGRAGAAARASSASRPRWPIRRSSPQFLDLNGKGVEIVVGEPGAPPHVSIIDAHERLPWGGHMGRHAVPEIYNIIRQHQTSIVFVNTRAQAELVFDALWRLNDENLPIGLHHGSLAVEQRRKVEAAMAAGQAARRGRDLLARSRHRLGRCRPGDPGRRAQGRQPPAAADRPRQPPPGRAVPRDARAGQPLRGAGVRWRRSRRSTRASSTAIRRGRAASTCWRSTSWAWPAPRRSTARRLFAEVTAPRPTAT